MNKNIFWMPNIFSPLQNYHTPHYCHELATITQHYHCLQQKHQQLKQQYTTLKNNYSKLLEKSTKKRRINRRPDTEIVRSHSCPFQQCKKEYASGQALNLHLQQKHRAGTRKQRENFAKKVIKCELEGKQPPKGPINLPPGYLAKNRVRLLLMLTECKSEESGIKQQDSS